MQIHRTFPLYCSNLREIDKIPKQGFHLRYAIPKAPTRLNSIFNYILITLLAQKTSIIFYAYVENKNSCALNSPEQSNLHRRFARNIRVPKTCLKCIHASVRSLSLGIDVSTPMQHREHRSFFIRPRPREIVPFSKKEKANARNASCESWDDLGARRCPNQNDPRVANSKQMSTEFTPETNDIRWRHREFADRLAGVRRTWTYVVPSKDRRG